MVLPESNLPPEAQKWRRAVEKALTDLQRRTGALQTNTKTTGARFSSLLTQTSAVERQVGETIDDLTEVAEKVERKDQSVWQPKAPVDPVHGQRWFDTTDGNVLRVWIDYGDYARYNYARNPSFSTDTSFWTAIGASLTRTVGPDPMARLDVSVDVEEPRAVVLIETQGRTVGEWLEGDPDNPDSGPSGFVGTPWAAGIDVQVVSGNEGVWAILDVVNDDDEVVSTSGPVEVSASTITRVLATPVEGENILEEVRVRLTVTNLSGGDTVFADKVMLEAVTDTEGDYFDGDMPGVGWVEHPEAGWVSEWLGYPDWYELQDEKILREAVDAASEALDEAGQLIDDLRERVGNKRWTGPTFEKVHFRWQPLGGGRVRFTSLYPDNDIYQWTFGGGAEPSSSDKYSVDVQYGSAGFKPLTHYTTGPSGEANYASSITLTSEMMDEDYGWSDQTFNLEDLTASGGPLDPSVLAELWEQVVVGGFLVATEAIIGPEAIIDGAVNARHMNVISEVPGGGAFTIDPTSLRIWNLGNDGPNANVVLSAQDGFKIAKDDGTPLLWIDPATGDLTTSGAVVSGGTITGSVVSGGTITGSVVSGGTITGSSFVGGEIDILDGFGAPVFHASPNGGVAIGGESQVFYRGLYSSSSSTGFITPDHVPVSPGLVYRVETLLERSNTNDPVDYRLDAVWYDSNMGRLGGESEVFPWRDAPAYGQGAVQGKAMSPPPNAAYMRLEWTRRGPLVTVRFTDTSITQVSPGDITVSGDVKAIHGVFNTLDLSEPVTVSGRQFLRDSGWEPLDLLADWSPNFPARRRRIDDQVFLSGEIICTDSAAGTGRPITVLPEGWRPPHRVRLPWGWGATLTSIVIEADGTVWSLSGVRTSTPGMHLNAVRFFIN